jgi:hypothetical protein
LIDDHLGRILDSRTKLPVLRYDSERTYRPILDPGSHTRIEVASYVRAKIEALFLKGP